MAVLACLAASRTHAGAGPLLLRDFNQSDLLPDRSPVGRGASTKRQLFFNVCDEVGYDEDDDPILTSCEMWRSAGKRSGTRPFGRRFSGALFRMTTEDAFYFSGCRFDACGTWKSDGSIRGTGLAIPDMFSVTYLVEVNGTTFFAGPDAEERGAHYGELWKSDGTQAGTVRVANINAVDPPFDPGSYPRQFAALAGTVYFQAHEPSGGTELWKTDGTAAGTVRALDLRPGPESSFPTAITAAGGRLFFWASATCCNTTLWTSDGTPGSAVRLGQVSPNHEDRAPLTHIGGTVFFGANDASGGRELWKSDGTPQGTMRVADINPGPDHSDPTGPSYSSPFQMAVLDQTLFFSAVEPAGGRELWKTDGSEAGTMRVADVNPGSGGSDPYYFTPGRGVLFFAATEPSTGRELWKTDGTAAGTVRLTDIVPGPGGSVESVVGVANRRVFFVADDGVHGPELWSLRVE
jgi:ELWxxDGT repeat protein